MRATKMLLSFLVSGMFLSSCTSILMSAMGLRNPKEYSSNQIEREARKQGVSDKELYVLDTSYWNLISSIDTTDKYLKKVQNNHGQPNQVMYFNERGRMISYHLNCYAQGIGRKAYLKGGKFEKFPPESAGPADSIITLNRLIKHINPLSLDTLPNLDSYDYVVVILFNRIHRKGGRRLSKAVQENLLLNTDKEVKVLYVNFDNFWFYKFGGFNK